MAEDEVEPGGDEAAPESTGDPEVSDLPLDESPEAHIRRALEEAGGGEAGEAGQGGESGEAGAAGESEGAGGGAAAGEDEAAGGEAAAE